LVGGLLCLIHITRTTYGVTTSVYQQLFLIFTDIMDNGIRTYFYSHQKEMKNEK